MDWSGERYIPGVGGQIETEHLHRYAIARELCSGLDVLDIACGEGYGANLVAERARSVVGVDSAPDAIAHAAAKYPRPNLQFRQGTCAEIPSAEASFDLIVSFETIEHHVQHEEMMSEFRRVLRPGGVLFISSPDKLRYADLPGHRNPYHVKELYADEFESLLRRYFREVRMFGQRVCFGSYVVPFRDDSRQAVLMMKGGSECIEAEKGIADPVFLVALAGNDKLPELACGIFENTRALVESVVHMRLQQAREELQTQWRRRIFYRLGDAIDFRKGGNAPLFGTEGWAIPNASGTWSVAERPGLRLCLTEPAAGALRLSARLIPLVAPGHEHISVQVFANGDIAGEWSFDDAGIAEVATTIPGDRVQGQVDLTLEFLIHEPRSPKELGLSGDEHKLGLLLIELRVHPA